MEDRKRPLALSMGVDVPTLRVRPAEAVLSRGSGTARTNGCTRRPQDDSSAIDATKDVHNGSLTARRSSLSLIY